MLSIESVTPSSPPVLVRCDPVYQETQKEMRSRIYVLESDILEREHDTSDEQVGHMQGWCTEHAPDVMSSVCTCVLQASSLALHPLGELDFAAGHAFTVHSIPVDPTQFITTLGPPRSRLKPSKLSGACGGIRRRWAQCVG